jgi:hypothetical protein
MSVKRFVPLAMLAGLAAPLMANPDTPPEAVKEAAPPTTPSVTVTPAPAPALVSPAPVVQVPRTVSPPPSIAPYSPATPLAMTLSGGNAIHINGHIGSGATARLRDLLGRNPEVKTIILSSGGGQVIEGMGIAALIRKKKLDTHVEAVCSSACTLAFLGGTNRSLSPAAQVGFHRAYRSTPTFLLKADPDGDQLVNDVMRQAYADSGLAPSVIDRTMATPSEDMWYPATNELIAARFATRIATPGEFKVKAGKWDSLAEIEAEIGSDPVWQAAKRAKRPYYLRALSTFWIEAGIGGKDNRARTESTDMLTQLLLSDMRKYPAELIDAFIQAESQNWNSSKSGFNARCSLSGNSMPVWLADKPESIAQQQALLVRMAETPVAPDAVDEAVRNNALKDMWQLWALMLADSAADSNDVVRGFCREPGRYYKMLMALDSAARVKLFRSIATVQTADARAK